MIDTRAQGRRATGVLSYLSLFTSFGTLLCCALPSLLALLGLGATVASFLSAVPWLVAVSHNKTWIFAISGLLIAGNLIFVYVVAPARRKQGSACSPDTPAACESASRFSRIVLWASLAIYVVGVFSAYVLGPLLMRFG
ncbi:MAG TPA: hypothetical protein VL285_01395 [Bryobacteraceae bacterium]|jgi:hypothetical protein|nr:hypothetical protein [Bryobacteraceae bacterium]